MTQPTLRLTGGPVSVLFVCTGNICRSPTAEGVFAKLVRESRLEQMIRFASAGTHDYHLGQQADTRSMHAARSRGYDLSTHRARKFTRQDFRSCDVILAMDEGHYEFMAGLSTPSDGYKLHLMMSFARRHPGVRSVPDPYYGGPEGFERVLDMLEDAADGLLEQIRAELGC